MPTGHNSSGATSDSASHSGAHHNSSDEKKVGNDDADRASLHTLATAEKIIAQQRRHDSAIAVPLPASGASLESKFTDDELLKTRSVILRGDDPEAKRAEIREYFHRTFSLFERLHEVLANDQVLYQQPDKLRHPLIFYLCHTAVLYINKLRLAKLLPRINEKIESTCAVGVDEMSWDDLNEGHYSWPTPDEARDYRNKARVAVDGLIQTLPISLPITWDSPWWIVLLGIEHERIHLETSSVLIRQLPITMVRASSLWKLCPKRRHDITSVPINELKPVTAGVVTLGRPVDHSLWGWDVDYGTHVASVQPFNASKYLVSNGEYHTFITDGGYDTRSYWTQDGWDWVTWKKARHPLFWIPIYAAPAAAAVPTSDTSTPPATVATVAPSSGDNTSVVVGDATVVAVVPVVRPSIIGYRYRAYAEEIDMPWDWPVDINQLEAKAFCNWKSVKTGKSIRLPTEEEWTRLREYVWPETSAKQEDQATWSVAPGNINLEHYSSSCPVDEFAIADWYDIIGNVWQHTETPVVPFNGFRTHPIYDDFSVPTFDTRHNMIMGGSWISTGNEATRHARYAFRRHFYQHAGFRYIESSEPVVMKERIPAPEPEVAKWADAHYGQSYLGVANYSSSLVAHVTATIDAYERRSTGRTTSRNAASSLSPSVAAASSIVSETKETKARSGTTGTTGGGDAVTGAGHEGRRRAVDIGCAAGRASFELGRHYDSVLGLDFSTRFFRVATQLQQEGVFRYDLPLSGELTSYHTISLDEMGLAEASSRVEFLQADACNLDPKYRDFDLVVASNLLSHLYAPAKFLDHIRTRLRPGAFLVIAETWDWRTDITPRDSWLGGYKEAGETVSNLDGLERKLGPDFTMIAPPHELQWLVRRSERSFDHHISQVTIWRLRA